MEIEKLSLFVKISKYVACEIVDYFEYKEILHFRSLNLLFNEASVLIWKGRLRELEGIIGVLNKDIENKFDGKLIEELKELIEMKEGVGELNNDLKICKRGGILFKNIGELEY